MDKPRKKSAREKLREYFIANVGVVLDSNTLKEIGGISEWARRIRELRNEYGYNILTHNDRNDLKPGEYVLVDLELLPAFERNVSKETRALVLDRNGFTCQMCGAAAGEIHPFDGRRVRLQIGHIVDKSQGGSDDYSNLRALCSLCNEGASNITLDKPSSRKLKAQVRRAPAETQLDLLKWLVAKFPKEARELAEQNP